MKQKEKRYKTIVVDPPWPYKSKRPFGSTQKDRPKSWFRETSGPSAKARYNLMSIERIKNLNIPSEKNAHLYLWTTNAFMFEAHEVVKAWGFAIKTILTWVKIRKRDKKPLLGMGYYFRNSTEHILFAIKGSMRLKNMIQLPTAYFVNRPFNQHSVKPDYFYSIFEKASFSPYLELFARKKRKGWDVWGDEVKSDISLL